MTEPPLEPKDNCGCGQCAGRCEDDRDPYDMYMELKADMAREDNGDE